VAAAVVPVALVVSLEEVVVVEAGVEQEQEQEEQKVQEEVAFTVVSLSWTWSTLQRWPATACISCCLCRA
jgi:hypothetical protein